MFDIIRQSLKTGIVTGRYPVAPAEVSARARGCPEIEWANWKDARPAAAVCPTGAISFEDAKGVRVARLDLGKCIFCGLCAEAGAGIRMTNLCECAASRRADLVSSAGYSLQQDGSHERLVSPAAAEAPPGGGPSPGKGSPLRLWDAACKSRRRKCSGVPCISARWTPVPATAVKWKSPA